MDPELRELDRGAREERRQMLDPDPHDLSGYGRPGRIDGSIPDAEYGDDLENGTIGVQWWRRSASALAIWRWVGMAEEETDAEEHAAIIRDCTEQLHDEVHESATSTTPSSTAGVRGRSCASPSSRPIAGLELATGTLNFETISWIVAWWIVTPVIGF